MTIESQIEFLKKERDAEIKAIEDKYALKIAQCEKTLQLLKVAKVGSSCAGRPLPQPFSPLQKSNNNNLPYSPTG